METTSPTNYLERLDRATARVVEARQAVTRDEVRHDMLEQRLNALNADIDANLKKSEVSLQVRTLFESLTDRKRELVRSKIEALVTHGIQSVFGPSYSFGIEQKLSRNQITFEYRLHHTFEGSAHTGDLRGAHGGGLVALVGFLLRCVMVLFVHPPRRRIIFLDETMAALDGDKRQSFAALLKTLGEKLNMQFVLISHSPEYSEDADKVYKVMQVRDGVTKLVLQG